MVVRCWKLFLAIVTFKKGRHQKFPVLIISFDTDKIMNILHISVSRDSVIRDPPEYIDSLPIAELPCPLAFMPFSFLHYGPEEKQSAILFSIH